MLRGLIVLFSLGMLSLATPAQAARELVCMGYGHTAQPGNIRILVDCNDMREVRRAMEDIYGQLSRRPRMGSMANICGTALSEARRWPDQMVDLNYSAALLSRCNSVLAAIPGAHEEVIPNLYRRYRIDNMKWQPFFEELVAGKAVAATGGTCAFRIGRQPLTPDLDARQVASGTATFDQKNLILNIEWLTEGQSKSKSKPPSEVRLERNALGAAVGERKVFHLWGPEHASGTNVEITLAGFSGRTDPQTFTQKVDNHWSMDIHFEDCAEKEVEPVSFDRAAFEGDWGYECLTSFNLKLLDDTTLRRSAKLADRLIELDFRYRVLEAEVVHEPTYTRLLAGDIVTYRSDGTQSGTVWRIEGDTIKQILSYLNSSGSAQNENLIDAGFLRRDGLLVANGEGVSEDIGAMKRISC